MDYRAACVIGFLTFGVSAGWIWLRSRRVEPRKRRVDNKHETAWKQVDVGFAVIALIFLTFDMEMIFMFPWAVAFQEVGMTAFWDMFVFAAILLVGLAYAGKRGAFQL